MPPSPGSPLVPRPALLTGGCPAGLEEFVLRVSRRGGGMRVVHGVVRPHTGLVGLAVEGGGGSIEPPKIWGGGLGKGLN